MLHFGRDIYIFFISWIYVLFSLRGDLCRKHVIPVQIF